MARRMAKNNLHLMSSGFNARPRKLTTGGVQSRAARQPHVIFQLDLFGGTHLKQVIFAANKERSIHHSR